MTFSHIFTSHVFILVNVRDDGVVFKCMCVDVYVVVVVVVDSSFLHELININTQNGKR
jgi:hypothetical protein